MLLEARDLVKTYAAGDQVVQAVAGVSLSARLGELVALVGASGSGKSTLLHLLGGLERPESGAVHLEGQEYGALSSNALTLLRRRRIGVVFQSYNLLPQLTVAENVQLPLLLDGRRPEAGQVDSLLESVGLKDRRGFFPDQLSGGQQQRVAIARAVITQPALLLADEPTGQLDSRTAQDVMRLLKQLCTSRGVTAIIATHDEKVLTYADRVLRMQDGQLMEGAGKEHEVS